jgi:hypothetical protein
MISMTKGVLFPGQRLCLLITLAVWTCVAAANAAAVVGSVVVWGASNRFGQLDLWPGLTNVIAITAGAEFGLALNANWATMPPIAGDGTIRTITNSATAPHLFYRVRCY